MNTIQFDPDESEFELSQENEDFIKSILPKYSICEKENLTIFDTERLIRWTISIGLEKIIEDHFEIDDEIENMVIKLAKFVEDYVTNNEEYILYSLTGGEANPTSIEFLETNFEELELNPDDFVITTEILEDCTLTD